MCFSTVAGPHLPSQSPSVFASTVCRHTRWSQPRSHPNEMTFFIYTMWTAVRKTYKIRHMLKPIPDSTVQCISNTKRYRCVQWIHCWLSGAESICLCQQKHDVVWIRIFHGPGNQFHKCFCLINILDWTCATWSQCFEEIFLHSNTQLDALHQDCVV